MKRYHVVVIVEKTGAKTYMTDKPVSHKEGCTILSKITDYSWRRKQLEEVVSLKDGMWVSSEDPDFTGKMTKEVFVATKGEYTLVIHEAIDGPMTLSVRTDKVYRQWVWVAEKSLKLEDAKALCVAKAAELKAAEKFQKLHSKAIVTRMV